MRCFTRKRRKQGREVNKESEEKREKTGRRTTA
jgi:hypothetical protein